MFLPVSIRGGQADWQPLEEFGTAIKDMSTPLGYVGDRLLAGMAQQFETQGGWGDRPWKELTPRYKQFKETRAPGLPILIGLKPLNKRGTRAQPIEGKAYGPSGKMRLELLSPSSVTVGPERLVYAPLSDIAGFHQTGTPKMVARPPVVIPLRELAEWDGAFLDWLDGLIERVEV